MASRLGDIHRDKSLMPQTHFPESGLCVSCKNKRFASLRAGDCWELGPVYQVSLSGSQGCPLCRMITKLVQNTRDHEGLRLWSLLVQGERKWLSAQEKIHNTQEGDIERLTFRAYGSQGAASINGRLALWTSADDPASSSIKRRPPITDLASDHAYQVIQEWLEDCEHSHVSCGKVEDKFLPTRLLDVGNQGGLIEPHLVEPSNGTKGKYVALSYCWGVKGQRIVLTLEGLKSGFVEFPLKSLPQTFQDAVLVTRRLGYKYLWIDALCIIQEGDDGSDFQREGGLMGDVYGNASITIAASGASSVYDGLFSHNIPAPESCAISFDLSDGALGTAYACPETLECGDDFFSEPLNTRAWCFQERLLSRRVLIYRKHQISWDCHTTSHESAGPLNPQTEEKIGFDGPGRVIDYATFNSPSEPVRSELSRHMSFWSDAITFYSRRLITRPADKLKALSGLAKVMQKETGDTYIAGMWSSCLLQQLLWTPRRLGAETDYRSKVYLAPSWSWASLDCFINLPFIEETEEYCPLAEIVSVHVEPVTELDPLGEIKSASLTIRASVVQRPLLQQWASQVGVSPIVGNDPYGEGPGEKVGAAPSDVITPVYVQIAEESLVGLGKYIMTLVLVPAGQEIHFKHSNHHRAPGFAVEQAFVRVGTARIQPEFGRYFGSVEQQTITII